MDMHGHKNTLHRLASDTDVPNAKREARVAALTATSAVLRLQRSLDCISGSVGHQHNIFRSFYHCQRFF